MPSATIEQDGLRGDHVWAVVDAATGAVASAKKFRRFGVLLTCGARIVDDTDPRDPAALELTMPDGTVVRGDDSDVDALLSDLTGGDVRLEPRTRSYDDAPLHVLSTSSVEALGTDEPVDVAARRFRPTIVVDTAGHPGFVDNGWLGATVRCRAVSLRPHKRTGRCVMVTLDHREAPARRDMLRTVMSRNLVPGVDGGKPAPCVGVYAQVETPGVVACGDEVVVTHPRPHFR